MKLSKLAAIAFIFLAVAGATYFINYLQSKYMNVKKVDFIASDNKKIAANLFFVEKPKGWLLLSHMMPATKESWNEFAAEMQGFGYESLAIDLRGHGKSEEGPNGYQKFSDADHQASINDLEAGWEFLQSRGAVSERTALIGASIGANLSLQFLAMHPEFKKGVLLSPGLNYHGIAAEPLIKELKNDQSIILATSKDDGNNAVENQKLYGTAPKNLNKHLVIFEKGGHGTNLLRSDEFDLIGAIKKFLEYGSIQ
jgi:alpha-beta hydrolase superfamily lysophospholipase